jgi:hypothetical protein
MRASPFSDGKPSSAALCCPETNCRNELLLSNEGTLETVEGMLWFLKLAECFGTVSIIITGAAATFLEKSIAADLLRGAAAWGASSFPLCWKARLELPEITFSVGTIVPTSTTGT